MSKKKPPTSKALLEAFDILLKPSKRTKRKPKDPLAVLREEYPGKWRVRKTNFNAFNYVVVCNTHRIAYTFNRTLARAIAKLGDK